MKRPVIVWHDQPLFKKTPFALVVVVVLFVGFNVYLNLKIKNTNEELKQIESAASAPRSVPAEFTKRIELGEKGCPMAKAGNPNAPVKFKLFESPTCPFCIAQDKVISEILPQYGDLFYGEWYQVTDCVKESEQYGISGVPTFVFSAKGSEKAPAYGFLDKQQLIDYICRVSGECTSPKESQTKTLSPVLATSQFVCKPRETYTYELTKK
ncbi:hypothetical protein HY384_02075 [Candidatus Daviesbacteria bacterium]|nr:hypothetical protein [Candidatus Daviesbacteria bacterium]